VATRYVLLGLLDIKPMSGYDIRRNLKISLDSLWSASYGQIYPTLHRLADQGLVHAVSTPTGSRERIVYHLTDEGRAEFEAWLNEPISYPPTRDPFRFWASYIDVLPAKTVRTGIDRHISTYRARIIYYDQVLKSIEDGEHPMIKARAASLPPDRLERLKATRSMIFLELRELAEFEIASAERIRRFWLDNLAEDAEDADDA